MKQEPLRRWASAVWREPALNHFRNGEYDPTVAHSRAATAEGCSSVHTADEGGQPPKIRCVG